MVEIADCDLKDGKTVRRVRHSAPNGGSVRGRVSLELVPAPASEKRILVVRERQVMLDEDLGSLSSPPPRPKREIGFRLPKDDD